MAIHSASLETIEDFLAQKRIAIVGVSRDPKDFTVNLFEEFCRRGYDVVPVNPNTAEIHGHQSFARVQDIQPPVEGVLLMTSPEASETVVKDCAEAGIRRIWMHRGMGKGSVSAKAIAFCRDHDIQVVPGQCPFMFLPDTAAFHRFHGFIHKITGRYPRRCSPSGPKDSKN
jgi:uncharacterized protein